MPFEPPEEFNIADYFLDARVREGRGDRLAVVCSQRRSTYREVQSLANRFGNLLRSRGVAPEQRVLVALPDGPEFVGTLFGILKIGAVVVMVNPQLRAEEIAGFYDYTRARLAIVHPETRKAFDEALLRARHRPELIEGLDPGGADELENFPSHRDDAAIWLFSGGTTGRPKAVVQTHRSFANTTECYAKGAVGYLANDRTLSVPKLYFGYATGSNLFFPFSVGATSILFPERCTAEALFEQIRVHRPTILVNVPTMVHQMVSHPDAARQNLSCLRFSTSAGEALPVDLYHRWKRTFGVELLDGLGTAEMWHIFLTNRPGEVRPGTLGKVVPGFEARVCDEDGRDVPSGEIGALWVKGRSRAIGYWQQMERTMATFRGEWYVTGDLVRRDAESFFTYCGRGDEMLKVGGKWVAPGDVENCLLQHPAVKECAVVGIVGEQGLVKPRAYVVAQEERAGLAAELQEFVKSKLEPHKYPREVVFLSALPRTHLGKVDRARLRKG